MRSSISLLLLFLPAVAFGRLGSRQDRIPDPGYIADVKKGAVITPENGPKSLEKVLGEFEQNIKCKKNKYRNLYQCERWQFDGATKSLMKASAYCTYWRGELEAEKKAPVNQEQAGSEMKKIEADLQQARDRFHDQFGNPKRYADWCTKDLQYWIKQAPISVSTKEVTQQESDIETKCYAQAIQVLKNVLAEYQKLHDASTCVAK